MVTIPPPPCQPSDSRALCTHSLALKPVVLHFHRVFPHQLWSAEEPWAFHKWGCVVNFSFQNIKCERKSIAQTLKQLRRKTNHGSWHHFDQLRAWGLYDTPQSIVSTLDSLKKGKVTWIFCLPPTLIQCIAMNASVSTRKGKWRVHVEPLKVHFIAKLHTIICRGSISQRLWSKKMLNSTRMTAKKADKQKEQQQEQHDDSFWAVTSVDHAMLWTRPLRKLSCERPTSEIGCIFCSEICFARSAGNPVGKRMLRAAARGKRWLHYSSGRPDKPTAASIRWEMQNSGWQQSMNCFFLLQRKEHSSNIILQPNNDRPGKKRTITITINDKRQNISGSCEALSSTDPCHNYVQQHADG